MSNTITTVGLNASIKTNKVHNHEDALELMIESIKALNAVTISPYVVMNDLENVMRIRVSKDAHNMSYCNDLGPLKSFTVQLPNCSVEFCSIKFTKRRWINVHQINRGSTWRIDADNWAHLITAITQPAPQFIGE